MRFPKETRLLRLWMQRERQRAPQQQPLRRTFSTTRTASNGYYILYVETRIWFCRLMDGNSFPVCRACLRTTPRPIRCCRLKDCRSMIKSRKIKYALGWGRLPSTMNRPFIVWKRKFRVRIAENVRLADVLF